MIRNYITCSMCLLIFFVNVPGEAAQEINITAKSAIVMEAKTGKILYQKNAEEKKYPASTTKILTLITALENSKYDDVVTTSSNAANIEGSSLWLKQGEQLKMLDMLYGIMLVSGNDATVAVAEHIAGTVEGFAALMNKKAQEIGAVNSHFTNSSGLPDPQHVSTAHDLARIAAYGYNNNPIFSQIVSTKHKIIPWPGNEFDRSLYNENRMLWLYDGANGVKTGYTEAAGRCLVSGAKRDDMQLIAVVLDSDRMWDDSILLLDYAFSRIKPQKLFSKDDIMKSIKIVNGKADVLALSVGEDFVAAVSNNDVTQFQFAIETPEKIEAPVQRGQKVGIIKVLYGEKVIDKIDLLATEAVERKSFFLWLRDLFLQTITFIANKL